VSKEQSLSEVANSRGCLDVEIETRGEERRVVEWSQEGEAPSPFIKCRLIEECGKPPGADDEGE
jgi:hypothetical protein